jgi:hypothetical protein
VPARLAPLIYDPAPSYLPDVVCSALKDGSTTSDSPDFELPNTTQTRIAAFAINQICSNSDIPT